MDDTIDTLPNFNSGDTYIVSKKNGDISVNARNNGGSSIPNINHTINDDNISCNEDDNDDHSTTLIIKPKPQEFPKNLSLRYSVSTVRSGPRIRKKPKNKLPPI